MRRNGEVRARDVRSARSRSLERDAEHCHGRRLLAAERLQLQDVRAVTCQGGDV